MGSDFKFQDFLNEWFGYPIKRNVIPSQDSTSSIKQPPSPACNLSDAASEVETPVIMSSGALPPINYKTLQQALETRHQDKNSINIIGVVASVTLTHTRGTDRCLTVELRDPSIGTHPGSNYFKIRFFIKKDNHAPPINDVGDVVVIRHSKFVGNFFITGLLTRVFVFKVSELDTSLLSSEDFKNLKWITDRPDISTLPPTDDEKRYVLSIWKWTSNLQGDETASRKVEPTETSSTALSTIISSNAQIARSRKQALLLEVQQSKFYDLTVEVVKLYKGYEGTTLYVTDYTSNNLFFDYKGEDDEFGGLDPAYEFDESTGKKVWKGPSGKMAMQMTLWSPHSDFVNEQVHQGDIVNLINVNVVHHKTAMNILEGKMHGDRRYPTRINVSLANTASQVYKDLITRKDAYWKKSLQAGSDTKSKLSRGQKKRQRIEKKRKQENKEPDVQEQNHDDPFTTAKTTTVNGHVTAGYVNKDTVSLSDIMHSAHLHGKRPDETHITYPFMNVSFKTQARVVDFFPPKIEDFAQNLDNPEYNDELDNDNDEMDLDDSQSRRWEWAFWLLLEDVKPNSRGERERAKVLVAGQDAEYLLRLDACDLRQNKRTLNELQEKLFVLWGELAERKAKGVLDPTQPLINKPFECCIQEYGIPNGRDGWIRLHRIFHTTIK